MTPAQYRLGLVFVTTSALAWSLAGLFTRALPTLDSGTLLAWRGIYGALGVAVLIVGLEGRRALDGFRRMGWPGWLFAIDGVFGMICYVTSLKMTTVAHVAVVYASIPFVAAAFAWIFLREKPTASAMVASLVALVGIAIMVGLGSEGHWTGDLLAFGMTVSMAIGMVIARRYRSIPLTHAAFASMLLSGLICWPLGAPLHVTGGQMVVLALFGIVNSSIGFGLFTLGARFLPAIETALIGSLDAPLAPLWVWIAFGEVPGMSTIAGGLMVFIAVGVYLALNAGNKSQASGETPAMQPDATL